VPSSIPEAQLVIEATDLALLFDDDFMMVGLHHGVAVAVYVNAFDNVIRQRGASSAVRRKLHRKAP
jgi:hypothetical protein